MALATVIAGAYTATYSGGDMGQQEDGFRLRQSWSKEEITSNTYGDAVIDAVFRGGNCFLSAVFIERAAVLKNAALSVFNPYATAPGHMGLVGRLDFALGQSVVLTAIAGLPAASAIASLTSTNAIIDQNLNVEVPLANRASYLGVTMRLYPYLSTDVKWYSIT